MSDIQVLSRLKHCEEFKQLHRIAQFIIFNEDCWIWIGAKISNGYGMVRVPDARRVTTAHRFLFELFGGFIGENMVLDHLCAVKSCVNPRHLQPCTNRQNIVRSKRLSYWPGEM